MLRKFLAEIGFIKADKPTAKGLLASRLYGENNILLAEVVWSGWLDDLSPEELAACTVMLSSDDRGGSRLPRHTRSMPTEAVARVRRQIRSLYSRWAEMEVRCLADQGQLRPPSISYIDFVFSWAQGTPLEQVPLPAQVDFGDAVRAIKSTYSVLRQLDFALGRQEETAGGRLRATVRHCLGLLERDLIARV